MDRKNVVCHLTLNRTKPIKLKQSIFNNESMFKCIMYLKNKVYLFPLFARIPVTDDQLEEVDIEYLMIILHLNSEKNAKELSM